MFCSCVAIFHIQPYVTFFISQLIPYAGVFSSYESFILRVTQFPKKLLNKGYVMERLKLVVFDEGLLSIWGSYQITWSSQWHSKVLPYTKKTPFTDQTLQMMALLPTLVFHRRTRGFHRAFANVETCQQEMLTPPDPWSLPIWDLHMISSWDVYCPSLVMISWMFQFVQPTILQPFHIGESFYWYPHCLRVEWVLLV